MKNVLVVYNPNSGRGNTEKIAGKLATRLTDFGFCAEIFRSESKECLANYFEESAKPHPVTACHPSLEGNCEDQSFPDFSATKEVAEKEKALPDCLVIVGGDGTVSGVMNVMFKTGLDLPLAIFGRGTANDLANYFGTGKSIIKFVKVFVKSDFLLCDTLLINDWLYALSNAGGGAFTNGVTKYTRKHKKLFGKTAYYTRAVLDGLRLKSQSAKITIDGEEINENIFLFLALNTTNIAGMKGVVKGARINDGLIHLIVVPKSGFFGKLSLAVDLLLRRLTKNKRAIYKTGKEVKVELSGKVIHSFSTPDIDGDGSAEFPLSVKISGRKVKILTDRKS